MIRPFLPTVNGLFYYSASALLAMQSGVIARAVCPSVHPSVRPSVRHDDTFRSFVQRNKDTILRSSASSRTIILVSKDLKFIRIFAEDPPSEGVKVKRPPVASEYLTNNQL